MSHSLLLAVVRLKTLNKRRNEQNMAKRYEKYYLFGFYFKIEEKNWGRR